MSDLTPADTGEIDPPTAGGSAGSDAAALDGIVGASDLVRFHVLVRGLVQGVWFRESTRHETTRHGVFGWVRNLPDGTVEAVFEGPTLAVEAMLAWAERGPVHARVDELIRDAEVPPGGAQIPGTVREVVTVGDVARAKGMTASARETGLGREGLYEAPSAGGNPEFGTV